MDTPMLTLEMVAYQRGKRYLAEQLGKSRPKGPGIQPNGDTRIRLAREYGVSTDTIRHNADFAKAVDGMTPEERELVLSGRSGLGFRAIEQGQRPINGQTHSLRTARRKARMIEQSAPAGCAGDIARQDTDKLATPKQPWLAALVESVKQVAGAIDFVLGESESIRRAAGTENWTQHAKTRVRADIQALKRDLDLIDSFLQLRDHHVR